MPVLNTADKLYLGGVAVDTVYVGANKVWPAFTPASLAGLSLWLDASQLALADGAAVSPWPDLSGAGHHGTIVGTPAPWVRANVLNGKQVVEFTTNAGRVRINGTGVTTSWTLVHVAHMVPRGNSVGRIVNGIYPPANLLIGFWNGFQDVFYDNGFATPNTQVAVTNDWKLYSADGLPTPLVRCFGNGVLLGTIATAQGWNGTFAINGYDPNDTSETCGCEVAEVCFYNRRLTGPERAQVEGYLRMKWAV